MELYIEEIYAAKKRRGAKGNSRSVGVRSIERFYRLIILLAIRKMKKKNRPEVIHKNMIIMAKKCEA